MASKEIAISLPEELVERLQGYARQSGVPLSTRIAGAAQRRARVEDGLAAVREWEVLDGAVPPEALAWARAELARADAALLSPPRQAG
jgi:hypothetical protein